MNTKQLFRVAVLLTLFAAAACESSVAPCLPDVEFESQDCNPQDPTNQGE